MSRIYDNWDRLVAAVLRRELIWKICHDHSRTPSVISSVSSDFGSSFSLTSPLSSTFVDAEDGVFMFDNYLPLQISANIKASVRSEEGKEEPRGQLVLIRVSPVEFGLQELLMAPSIALGDKVETFRNAYLVRLREDFMIVVKRFSRGKFTDDVLEEKLKMIGSIKHENVVKMMGYYLNEDECLAILEYFPQGSLETMLHGEKGKNRVHLNWEARVRIATGAAKGLVHLHRKWRGKFAHGNIKASNIFLNSDQYGCISDITIATSPTSNYDPPEVSLMKKTSQASDIYSFGVLLIELLSGRSPLHSTGRHQTFIDWALHHARDEWTSLVFDKKLLKDHLVKQAMWKILAVALSCVEKIPEERPTMAEVVDMLEYHIFKQNLVSGIIRM
ncbi:putative inactive receptor kinase [Sesamum alatum]|uniref:Inactive receptor kinase n=1 Tax=Sesamum alatum TaxID=300844 RepID=A0AAE2CRC7_9LAMI|nr:putative inactive receptor kinase [Sesamum alatum]